jgi:hypothetical protein
VKPPVVAGVAVFRVVMLDTTRPKGFVGGIARVKRDEEVEPREFVAVITI